MTKEVNGNALYIPKTKNIGEVLPAPICATVLRGRMMLERIKELTVLGKIGDTKTIHNLKDCFGFPAKITLAHSNGKIGSPTSMTWGEAEQQ